MIMNCDSPVKGAENLAMFLCGLFTVNPQGDDDLNVVFGNAASL